MAAGIGLALSKPLSSLTLFHPRHRDSGVFGRREISGLGDTSCSKTITQLGDRQKVRCWGRWQVSLQRGDQKADM